MSSKEIDPRRLLPLVDLRVMERATKGNIIPYEKLSFDQQWIVGILMINPHNFCDHSRSICDCAPSYQDPNVIPNPVYVRQSF